MRAAGTAADIAAAARAPMIHFEPKWDGFRLLVWRQDDQVRLQSRHGTDLSRYLPDLCAVLAAHLPPRVILDGEVISWDTVRGRTSFTQLQRRFTAGRRIDREAAEHPVHFVAFDVLRDLRGRVLLDKPLAARRQRLERLLVNAPPQLALCPQTDDQHVAETWYAEWPKAVGVEGVVAKNPAAPYTPGKAGWVKIKSRCSEEYILGGVTGTAQHPNSLLLGRLDAHGRLRFLAQTHPIRATQRAEVGEMLRPMAFRGDGSGHPWPLPLPAAWSVDLTDRRPVHYLQVEPTVVVEVETDVARDGPLGRVRHRVRHLRVRADLAVTDVATV